MFNWEFLFLELLQNLRTDFFNKFFEFITILGEETVYILLICTIYFMFNKRLAKKLFFIAATSIGFNCIVKNAVKLPRPFANGRINCVRAHTATGYSFPSGHTQIAATCTSALYLALKKKTLLIFSIVATLLVGFSRLYLGAHFPLDVIFGIIFGIGLSNLLNYIYDRPTKEVYLNSVVIGISTVFAIIYLFSPNILYLDFYKFYGLFLGYIFATSFEQKYVNFDYNTSLFKKILRVVIGVVLAFSLKEGIKMILQTDDIYLSYLFNVIRYFLLVAIVFGLLPLVFKKIKI